MIYAQRDAAFREGFEISTTGFTKALRVLELFHELRHMALGFEPTRKQSLHMLQKLRIGKLFELGTDGAT